MVRLLTTLNRRALFQFWVVLLQQREVISPYPLQLVAYEPSF